MNLQIAGLLITAVGVVLTAIVAAHTLLESSRQRKQERSRLDFSLYPGLEEVPRNFFDRWRLKKLDASLKVSDTSTVVCFDRTDEKMGRVVTPLILSLRNPSDTKTVRSIAIDLKYPAIWHLSNDQLRKIFHVSHIEIVDRSAVLVRRFTDDDKAQAEETLSMSRASVTAGVAHVRFEIPVLRPHEIVHIDEPFLMGQLSQKERCHSNSGSDGFMHILGHLNAIPGLKDYFHLKAWIYADEMPNIHHSFDVMRIQLGSDVSLTDEEENELSKRIAFAYWFGESLKAGIYYSDAIKNIVDRLRGKTGRLGNEIFRPELFYTYQTSTAKAKLSGIGEGRLEFPSKRVSSIAVISVPNCDRHEIPREIDSRRKFLAWMGLDEEPIIPENPSSVVERIAYFLLKKR